MIKVATDCSGIGSPEQALKELGVPHEIVFMCERDKYARQTYLANFEAKNVFTDMTTRDNDELDIYADLYLAGIPCQAFSLAGKRLGELDPRGLLFYNFYDYVKKKQPKVFVIENVKGLLSDAEGRTFQNWIDLLSASVNTEYNMFPHEDSLEYNIHWTVLNSKDFGVPQNRERVFIVGIRKDLPNTFRFPIGFPLTIRLKDVLEPLVSEKYYLSEKMLEDITFEDKGNGEVANLNKGGQKGGVYHDEAIMSCLSATDYKQPKQIIIKKDESEPICVAMRGRNPDNPSDRTTGANTEQRLEPNSQGITNTITSVQKDNLIVEPTLIQKHQDWRQGDEPLREYTDVAPTIRANMGDNMPMVVEPRIIQHNMPEIVSVRKFEVDIIGLQALLKEYKNCSIKKISEALGAPKTMVEHWFRTDKCFSIPDPKYWFVLKGLLGIETDEFDASITEFEEKENVFEKANRVYDENGIAPTITSTSADERILTHNEPPELMLETTLSGGKWDKMNESIRRVYNKEGLAPTVTASQGGHHEPKTVTQNRIRRLTPLECFRLQGFPDSYIKPVSDTQLYKQAGNSITVHVIKAIIKNLLPILQEAK